MPRNWQHLVTQLLPAVLLGVLAFACVLAATDPPGPGLDPDAVSYLGAAESLVHSGSYRVPTTEWDSPDSTEALAHFPPGYSTMLAAPIALGMDPIQGARLVEAIAAFVSTTMLVLLVTSVVGTRPAVLLALSLFAMTAIHEVHVSVLSEPVYLACTVLVLAAMVWWPDRPLRAGIPAAIAVMTRYAGASLVAAVALWAIAAPGRVRDRLKRGMIAVLPSVVLQIVWVIRTHTAHNSEDIRDFAIYGKLGPTFREGLTTIILWLVPDPIGDGIAYRGAIALAVGIVLITLVAMGVAWLRWKQDDERAAASRRLLYACALLAASYAGMVMASRLLADPLIPFDQRILSPALMLTMIMFAITITAWWRHTRRRVTQGAVAAGFVAWWLAAAGATWQEVRYDLERGSDFAGQEWRTSDVIQWARTHAVHTPLYTNWPVAVFFWLHRTSHELPHPSDISDLPAFVDTVRARHGIILIFGAENGEYVPSDSIFNAPGLQTIIELHDGSVLGPAATPATAIPSATPPGAGAH